MRLEQALFGYKGGHRRLASSISFQPGDERFLVRMTDLSGSRSMPGFENYISGYALPSGSAYVFAKTWYAPECERPGCVWTHVIVVRHQDWEGLTPAAICGSFRRPPAEKPSFDQYSDSIETSLKPCDDDALHLQMRDGIVRSLYSDDRPIIISESEKRTNLSSFVISLVLQRPLAMRLSLSFCTGALSFLEANSVPIRIQAMPSRIARIVREEVHLLPNEDVSLIPAWAEWLVRDLQQKDAILGQLFAPFEVSNQTLRESDAVPIIRSLAEARALFENVLDESSSPDNALRGIVELFPNPDEQVAFKNTLVKTLTESSVKRRALLQFVFDSEDRLVALDGTQSALVKAASLSARQDPAMALQLLNEVLFRPHKSKVAQDIIHCLLADLRLLEVAPARPVDPQVLFAIAREQRELVSMSGFWLFQRSFEESTELAESLAEDLGDEPVLQGLLATDRFDLLIQMLRMRGARGALEALRLARGLSLGEPGDYNKVLALRGEILDFAQTLAWGEAYAMRPLNAAQLFILASSNVEPKRLVELAPDLTTWLEALEALPAEPHRIFAVAVFLACGDEFREGWKLFSKSFDVMHRAIGSKAMASDWWWLIKSRLPSLAVWEKWDKCERLRRGAVDSILRHGLPSEALNEVSQDRSLQNRLRGIYQDRK
jgi:hypothetical protein